MRFVGQAAIWGSSFAFIKIALEDLIPSQLVVGRLVLGALALAVFALSTRVALRMPRAAWVHVAISAVFANVVPYLLLSYGEQHTDAGIAGVLVGATPLLTVLIAAVALRDESMTLRRICGFAIGFFGVAVVVAPWSTGGGSLIGSLACFGAAVSYALGYVYVRRFISPHQIRPVTLATNQLIAAAMIMLVISPLFPWQPVSGISVSGLGCVILLGVISTGFANILYFRLIQDIGASSASAVDYLVPVFAVLFGVVLLAEPLTLGVVIGGGIVLFGMGIAENRNWRRRPSTRMNSS